MECDVLLLVKNTYIIKEREMKRPTASVKFWGISNLGQVRDLLFKVKKYFAALYLHQ